MIQLINIGFGNLVNKEKIVAVLSSDSAPAKRLVIQAKEDRRVLDATQGRKTKSVMVMDSGHIVLSALQTETLASRLDKKQLNPAKEEG